MNLKKGERVKVGQLMYGALLLSGNDAAYALGETVSGSNSNFATLMNQRAVELGCQNTHFVNPNGIYNKNHYTTANDFVLITRAAMSNSIVTRFAGAKKYRMGATNKSGARRMVNHATLLNEKNSGVYAGKCGYWTSSDCSVAVGYKKNGISLYIVILGDTKSQRKNDLCTLIDYSVDKVSTIESTN